MLQKIEARKEQLEIKLDNLVAESVLQYEQKDYIKLRAINRDISKTIAEILTAERAIKALKEKGE